MYSGHIALLSKINSGLTVNKLSSGWVLILNSGRNEKQNSIRAVLLKVNINFTYSVFHDKLGALLEKILSHEKEPSVSTKTDSDNRVISVYSWKTIPCVFCRSLATPKWVTKKHSILLFLKLNHLITLDFYYMGTKFRWKEYLQTFPLHSHSFMSSS